MDISKASNFERFVFDLVGRDPKALAALWEQLSTQGYFDLSDKKAEFENTYGFVAGTSSHADRLETIRSIHQETGVLIDPHTADGVKVAAQFVEEGIPMLVLETALPAKFSETIEAAIGEPAPVPAHLQHLASLPQKVEVLDADVEQIRRYVETHAAI